MLRSGRDDKAEGSYFLYICVLERRIYLPCGTLTRVAALILFQDGDGFHVEGLREEVEQVDHFDGVAFLN